jgi:hypothetical protein
MAIWTPDSFYSVTSHAGQSVGGQARLSWELRPEAATAGRDDGGQSRSPILELGQILGRTALGTGDDVHHFGWNA